MKLKKILAGVLAAVVAVGSLSVAAFADTDESGNFVYKVLDDGTVSITGYLGNDENVVIPDTIDGKAVTAIDRNAFYLFDHIVTVEIPDSVTVIGEYAFVDCTSLTEVVIPDSVATIGINAFTNCTSLKKVVIPDSLTTIESYVFYYCTSLAEVVIPDSVTKISSFAFSSCISLTALEIPDSVTEIGDFAFRKCGFTSITIPDSVTKIGYAAFAECASLKEIVIPDSVASIGQGAFTACSSLEALTVYGNDINLSSIFDAAENTQSDGKIPENLTIYGYEGSTAEAFAKEKGIKFEVIKEEDPTAPPADEDKPLEDKETGIEVSAAEGVIPEGAVLKVEADKENSDPSSVAFDITLTADGKPADIKGNVTVTIPVPEELKGADKYYVFYKAEDGTLTDMKATYKDGVITFTATHFSTYIVSTVNLLADKGDSPNTGIEGVAIFAGLAAVAAAAVVISKKRR